MIPTFQRIQKHRKIHRVLKHKFLRDQLYKAISQFFILFSKE
ncbi:Conserved hypothetical protein [Prochlorococcus marinus str. NATL2A]|uniref:Uncharacterized protein n=1 Tax=Prochlorococcus marinus (strain NATL2A) TaxID=59920 RepID=A7MDR8_PROMT|nr:Conserved hypothetical protein [Prochlorococcus marinus str. NATL2A]